MLKQRKSGSNVVRDWRGKSYRRNTTFKKNMKVNVVDYMRLIFWISYSTLHMLYINISSRLSINNLNLYNYYSPTMYKATAKSCPTTHASWSDHLSHVCVLDLSHSLFLLTSLAHGTEYFLLDCVIIILCLCLAWVYPGCGERANAAQAQRIINDYAGRLSSSW